MKDENKIIRKLIELYEKQENIKIAYKLKKKER